MTARCPHFRKACEDRESRDCHYVKVTVAGLITALSGVERLSFEKQAKEVQDFVGEARSLLNQYFYGIRIPF